MTMPLMILAVGAVGAGLAVGSPISHLINDLLGKTEVLRIPAEEPLHLGLMLLSSVFALGGIAVAWWMYVRQPGLAGRLTAHVRELVSALPEQVPFRRGVRFFIVRPLAGIAEFCRVIDLHVLDGFVDMVGQIPRAVGFLFRPIQNGLLQFYALAMTLSVTVFLTAMLWRMAR